MDREPARALRAAARRRPPPSDDVEETPEEVRAGVRAILSRLAPPPAPDPLTGRVVGMRGQPSEDAPPLTASQLHRRIMEIARQAGLVASAPESGTSSEC